MPLALMGHQYARASHPLNDKESNEVVSKYCFYCVFYFTTAAVQDRLSLRHWRLTPAAESHSHDAVTPYTPPEEQPPQTQTGRVRSQRQ